MEAFFRLPIVSSSADSSSSLSDGAGSVGVLVMVMEVWWPSSWPSWLWVAWLTPEDGSLWCPPRHGPQQQSRHQLVFGTEACGSPPEAIICMALSMSTSGSPLSEDGWSWPISTVPPGITALPFFLAFFWSAWASSSFFLGCFRGVFFWCVFVACFRSDRLADRQQLAINGKPIVNCSAQLAVSCRSVMP